jgi:hypothetical protein
MLRAAFDRWEALGRPLMHLPRAAALALLALLIVAMALSIPATAAFDQPEAASAKPVTQAAPKAETGADIGTGDLALYARVTERVAAGEDYYTAAMAEQRAQDYPTRPFVAVRLPTLALLGAALGLPAMRVLAMALLAAAMAALQFRLEGYAKPAERAAAQVLLVFAGAAALVVPQIGLIHEVFAGLLLTLALLLYRPERWWPSLLAAGLALAVRELTVPFVLLWLAFALGAGRWRESAGVGGLLAVFAIGMTAHYFAVEAGRLPDDPVSQGWQALMGYGLPILALIRLTPLTLLPSALAAAVMVLPLLGWFAIGGRLGLFACLWFAGFLTAVALFARPENFYWAQLVLPAYAIGLAFAPRALFELGRAALLSKERRP